MSCITKGNIRCTKCCEVLHINKSLYQKHITNKVVLNEADIMFGKNSAWSPVSYRRAKKINPYLVTKGDKEAINKRTIKSKGNLSGYLHMVKKLLWKYGPNRPSPLLKYVSAMVNSMKAYNYVKTEEHF